MTIFYITLLIHILLFILTALSIFYPKKRIWPPPSKNSWQYSVYWGLFYLGIVFTAILVIFNYNSWIVSNEIRYFVGLPFIVIGLTILCFAIYILGMKNTYGLEDGFKIKSIYKYTRNPQYLGDMIMLTGLVIFINSIDLTMIFSLQILTFAIMPFSEEIWLEEKYGEEYLNYKQKTSRFI
jgi:protein-S-isoprenylcysteine O-methyltransferase Ste14